MPAVRAGDLERPVALAPLQDLSQSFCSINATPHSLADRFSFSIYLNFKDSHHAFIKLFTCC